GQWSQQAVSRARDEGRLAINSIMYAQVSTGFDTIEDLDAAVAASDFEREPLPYEAGFVASRV
ncbi:MAG: DNA-binding protein, partial [Candidatus Dormiibacterota bacterium]